MASDIYGTVPRHHTSQHHGQKRSQALQDFQRKAQLVLTQANQEYFFAILKEFQLYKQTDKFVQCLQSVLDTPVKLDLLVNIRAFVPHSQLSDYDHLAPYHKMAHPWKLTSHGTLPRQHHSSTPTPLSAPNTPRTKPQSQRNGIGDVAVRTKGSQLRTITVLKSEHEPLGFSIRGGSEHGLGIFVSEVESSTAAERSGLQPGDCIVEANSISFENIAASSAIKVLTGSHRLQLTICRLGKIPGFRGAHEKISWFDTVQARLVEGTLAEMGVSHQPGLGYTDGTERRINLTSNRKAQFLGFNIRGGSEFGLGIYISRVDPGGEAEQKGLKPGDMLLEVNGQRVDGVDHTSAVHLLRAHRQLVISVRDVGRYPVFKEIYAEYHWVDTQSGDNSKSRLTGSINSFPVNDRTPGISRETFRAVPMETKVEAFAQTDDSGSESPLGSQYGTTSEVRQSFFPSNVGVQTDDEDSYEAVDEDGIPALCNVRKLNNDFDIETSSQRSVLVPKGDDVLFKEMPPEVEIIKLKQNREISLRKKESSPRPTLAVRAMEMQAAREHPDLARELASLSQTNDSSTEDLRASHISGSKKSRSLKGLFFGSKSKSGRDRSGAEVTSKPKSRKPLSGLSFNDNGAVDEPDKQVFESGLGSQLNLSMAAEGRAIHGLLEDHARKLLSRDEVAAVLRHCYRYEAEGGLALLLSPLLALLDLPPHLKLLEDVRSFVRPTDLAEYDQTVLAHSQRVARARIAKSDSKDTSQHIQSEEFESRSETCHFLMPSLYVVTASGNSHFEADGISDEGNNSWLFSSKKDGKFSRVKKQKNKEAIPLTTINSQNKHADGNDYDARRPQGESKIYRAVTDMRLEPNTEVVVGSRPSAQSGIKRAPSVLSDSGSGSHYSEIIDAPAQFSSNFSSSENFASTQQPRTRSPSPFSSVLSDAVYAQIAKRPSQAQDALPDQGYIDSTVLQPVYEAAAPHLSHSLQDSLAPPLPARHDTTLDTISYTSEDYVLYNDPRPGPTLRDLPNMTQDIDSQSDIYATTAEALGILDSLGDDLDNESRRTPSPRPPSFYTGSIRSSPISVSSCDSSRVGSYDVNQDSDGDLNMMTSLNPVEIDESSLRRQKPPKFIPPPPPTTPPPPQNPIEVKALYSQNEWGQKRAEMLPSPTITVPEPNVDTVPGFHGNHVSFEREDGKRPIRVMLDKSHKSLGMSISGGRGSRTQPIIRVQDIYDGGAAQNEGTLKSGMQIVSIDGGSLQEATHAEAVDMIRRAFSNKRVPYMELLVHR